MRWLLFEVLLVAVTHLEERYVQGFGMQYGYSDPRLMLGITGRSTEYESEPILLNCFSRLLDQQGHVASQLTVNIFPNEGHGSTRGLYSYGDYAGKSGSRGGLSANIQLSSNLKDAGKAYVFFTETADVSNGCSNEGFGKILFSDKDRSENKWAFGLATPGFGSGYGPEFYGWGNGYTSNYGYGSYGTAYGPGLSFAYGAGNAHGLRFGVGRLETGFGTGLGESGFGLHFGRKQSDKDAVTVLRVTPGSVTSAVVDNVGFDDLDKLAGRGVVLCSGVTYDFEWKPVCEQPFYSCCSLKYDNVQLSLVGQGSHTK